MNHLLVVAAGTGGHVMPGLAVANALRERGWQVSWLGTRVGMESGLVAPSGIAFHAIDFSGLRGKGMATLLTGGFTLLRALWQALVLMRRLKPDVVFSTGGYVAVPAGMAASLCGLPLVLLNADAAPLLSTRMLQPLASGVLCGFAGAAATHAGDKALVIGNPVRADVAQVGMARALGHGPQTPAGSPLRVLVVGGSLGAQVLNSVVPQALALLPAAQRPQLIHQSGARHVAATQRAYAAAGIEVGASVQIVPFISDIARTYAHVDVVLCRAGAITVSELCAAGLPAILVPLVVRTTDHQRTNAVHLADAGAAIHLPQAECTAARLAELLAALDPAVLLAMGAKARALARPDAARIAADLIERLARTKSATAPVRTP